MVIEQTKMASTVKGVFLQPNGSLIAQRGGIMRPIGDARITCVADIENLPWTRDQIADAYLMRMCDEFVRDPSTNWETKKLATFAMIEFSHGFIATIDDDVMRNILACDGYASEDNNGRIVKMWQLGDLTPEPNSRPEY